MSLPLPENRIFAGAEGALEFAVKSVDGMAEGWEWFVSLPQEVQRRFSALFRRWCIVGEIHNEEHFKRLDGSVYEFKTRSGFRFLCFRQDQRLILTNGLQKSGRKNINDDIQRCKNIAQGHFSWEQSQSGTRLERLPNSGSH